MKIKIVSKNPLFARTPFEYAPGYVFTADPACRDYDWLIVFDDLGADEPLSCPRERTILATWEPVSIKNYCHAFTSQFGHLLTNRPPWAERHPHYHLGRGYFPWYNGRSYDENKSFVIPPKTKVVAAVCSSKAMKWTRHAERIEILRRLVADVPGAEWYGHGVHEFARKYDVMDEYKYHVAIENQIGPHYWTEKLADAFLCECLPFYAGAPDIADDFPSESIIPIPVDDPSGAISIIKDAIAADEWARRIEAIRESKRLLLEKYNFWAQTIGVIESESGQELSAFDSMAPAVLHPRKYIRSHSLSAKLEDGWFHARQYLSGAGLWKKMS